jgi:hypothetical protein
VEYDLGSSGLSEFLRVSGGYAKPASHCLFTTLPDVVGFLDHPQEVLKSSVSRLRVLTVVKPSKWNEEPLAERHPELGAQIRGHEFITN